MRVVFMGTPDIAVPSLQALIDAPDVEVTLVVSQPDRRVGRGKKVRPTPVARTAADAGIPLFQPASLKTDDAYARLAAEEADLFVIVAYGQILRQRVLDHALDGPTQGSGTQGGVIALVGQVMFGRLGELESDALLRQAARQAAHHETDDPLDLVEL